MQNVSFIQTDRRHFLALAAGAAALLSRPAWAISQGEHMNATDFKQIFPPGERNDAYARYFTGQSYRAVLAKGDANVSNITFEPGCRNHWHIHHGAGQILLCTAGEGWYQEAGKPAQRLKAGDTVNIAQGVKHWHGAVKDRWFSHLSVSVPKKGAHTEWLEPVSDEWYAAL